MSEQQLTCGYVAVVGRPNVGKSTLMNAILGNKISITSSKRQTTRHRILGIKTTDHTQTIYVDTPGLQHEYNSALHRYLNKTVQFAICDVDLIVFVIEQLRWTKADAMVANTLQKVKAPVLLVINKIDKLTSKSLLLPFMDQMRERVGCLDMIPLSAKTADNIDNLEKIISKKLPVSPYFYFPKEQYTSSSSEFMTSELIREKLFRYLGQELPYAMTVTIDKLLSKPHIMEIQATIWVERPGQKAIVLGPNGNGLKTIGTKARIDMEKLFKQKVFLRLWVKIRRGWSNNEQALRTLGYGL